MDEREGYQIRLSSDFQPAARRNFLGRAHLAVNALVAEQLPIHGEVTARTRYIQAANSPYVPTWWGRWTVGGAILALIALVWWIGYNANRVFLANVANDGSEVGQEPTSPLGDRPRTEADWRGKWEDLTEYEQAILVRIIVDEGIVNPGQRPLVLRLLREGLLEFRPGLRLAEGLKQFLNQSGHNLNELADKELKAERVGWSQVRWVLLVIVFGASLFLFTTQPEFPTWITGAATAIASLVSVLLRLRDSLGTWFSASAKGL